MRRERQTACVCLPFLGAATRAQRLPQHTHWHRGTNGRVISRACLPRWHLWLVCVLAVLPSACAGRPAPATSPLTLSSSRACDDGSPQVTWELSPQPVDRAVLDRWCDSVGPPVVLQGTTSTRDTRQLLVISWNVHVGGGRVQALVEQLKATTPPPPTGDLGIVLLLQETFRAGSTIPATAPPGLAVPRAIKPVRPTDDIVAIAWELGYWLAYVPSMRNGDDSAPLTREDRGTAVLSSEPLDGITAIELPFGRQRRVAVMATVHPHGRTMPLRVVSGHFDGFRGTTEQATRLATSVAAHAEGIPVVVGVDTNATFGTRSNAVGVFEPVAPRVRQCGSSPTSSWFARVDYLFSTLTPSSFARCETLTRRYGSDHLPIVAVLDLP